MDLMFLPWWVIICGSLVLIAVGTALCQNACEECKSFHENLHEIDCDECREFHDNWHEVEAEENEDSELDQI
jgi:hypothetical protein